jgi:hypothetical protein
MTYGRKAWQRLLYCCKPFQLFIWDSNATWSQYISLYHKRNGDTHLSYIPKRCMRRFAWYACHSRTINHCRATCKVIWRNGYYKRKRGVKRLEFTWINSVKLRYGYLFDISQLKTEQYNLGYALPSYKIPKEPSSKVAFVFRRYWMLISCPKLRLLLGFCHSPPDK